MPFRMMARPAPERVVRLRGVALGEARARRAPGRASGRCPRPGSRCRSPSPARLAAMVADADPGGGAAPRSAGPGLSPTLPRGENDGPRHEEVVGAQRAVQPVEERRPRCSRRCPTTPTITARLIIMTETVTAARDGCRSALRAAMKPSVGKTRTASHERRRAAGRTRTGAIRTMPHEEERVRRPEASCTFAAEQGRAGTRR